MQLLRNELERARANMAGAEDARAQAALTGVIMTLEWAIEDAASASPADRAAALRTPDEEPPEKKKKKKA